MDLEIARYLVLSTAHVHCATAELLDQWAQRSPIDQPLPVASTQWGWFIATQVPEHAPAGEIPSELPPILAFARAQGCAHVLFDCDGPRVAALPEFPW